jgi:DNA mismatch repair protein MLH3
MNNNMEDISGQETQNTSSTILPLPEDVVAQIKSSTTITSLNQVILGLFENSLDAQPTKIDISVDYRRGGCTVEDNGIGILPLEFRETGELGRMYHTSKQQNNAQHRTHGGQGTFLASVAALSLLTITSRHTQHYSHNCMSLHRSKVISRLMPAPAQHAIRTTTGHGTRVSVRDLFGNMPVRVKQRAIVEEGGLESERQWQALKVGLVSLLLPWNRRVVLKVTDSENSAKTLSINTGPQFIPNALSERNLNILTQKMSEFDQSTVLSILCQSGVISIDSKNSWIPVSASTSSVTVKGIMSLEPAPSRAAQFMSIGIIPCLDENRHNELYETVNRLFSQSSFGHIDDESEPDEAEMKRRQHDRRYKRDGPTNKQLQGGRKGVDRWPRFYFHIDLKAKESTRLVSNLSDMHLKSIINVLESLTIHWLEANNFRPKKPRPKRKQTVDTSEQPGQPSSTVLSPNTDRRSSKRARSGNVAHTAIPTMPFTDWSRIKSARPQMYDSIWKSKIPPSRQSITSETVEQERSRKSNSPATINVEPIPANQFGTPHDSSLGVTETQESNQIQPIPVQNQDREAYVDWVDPKTSQRHRINARTGVIMPEETRRPASNQTTTGRATAAANSRLSSFGNPLVLERRKSTTPSTNYTTSNAASTSPWLQGFLQTWKNPIFETQSEEAIPTAGLGELVQGTLQSHDHHGHCAVADSFSHAGMTDTSRLSKSALAYAQVISQVDNKFILMKIPSLAGSKSQELNHDRQLLVLVDQHAASERCILEELLTELCTPAQGTSLLKSNLGLTSSIVTEPVNKPLHFQIPPQEEAMFRAHAAHFATWGILYNITPHQPSQPRLNILTLPPCISSRLHTSPHLLIELLRTEIHNDSNIPNHTITSSATKIHIKHTWLQHIASCPRGILSLLNSRACRSAVMFNDVLDREQCQGLVDRVKGTAFPFVCAHGRNSMVPLVYLGGEGEGGSGGVGGFGAKEERSRRFGMEEERREKFGVAYKKWRNKAAGV